MKARILGLVGLVICLIVAYFSWKYLSIEESVTKKAIRNGVIVFLILPSLFFGSKILFGSSKKNENQDN